MGVLATLRAKLTRSVVGVMITASHNPEDDNGVKLIDPDGGMLDAAWETYATMLVDASNDGLLNLVRNICDTECISTTQIGRVLCARDTRPSCSELVQCVQTGVEVCDGQFVYLDMLTTPQLHYCVWAANNDFDPSLATEEGYCIKISSAFNDLYHSIITVPNSKYNPCLLVDCANGVGAQKFRHMLPKLVTGALSVQMVNVGEGKLNHRCGADYVKIAQAMPEVNHPVEAGCKCASFDGDADRVVHFFLDAESNQFCLLDGDRLLVLFVGFIQDLLQPLKPHVSLHVGVVQTAYANGASTKYIENELHMTVSCVPTGVKYLHKKAHEYDIGVYFEANGHGTVLFSEKALSVLAELVERPSLTDLERRSAQQLLWFSNLINQCVGDAISDLLAAEIILRYRGWSIQDWARLYTDFPNRQLKVEVLNRSVITTTDAERRVQSPPGLQAMISDLVMKYPMARSFVRPSGTENVVRVYAESLSQNMADKLAAEVALAVYEFAGGLGPKPSIPGIVNA